MLMQSNSPGNPAQGDIDYLFLAYSSVNFYDVVLSDLSRRLAPLGITPVQMAIVCRCRTGEANTVTGLSQTIPIGAPGISRQVEHLVQKGLLERLYSREDRRMIHLLLTEKAEAMMPDILRCCQENESTLLEGVSDEEKRTFATVVYKILDNSKKEVNSPPPRVLA